MCGQNKHPQIIQEDQQAQAARPYCPCFPGNIQQNYRTMTSVKSFPPSPFKYKIFMLISFLWRPQKAPEKLLSLSPPKHLRIQRPRAVRYHRAGQDRAQSCQAQTSMWPQGLSRMGKYLSSAPSPERAQKQLCSVPWAGSCHTTPILQAFVPCPVASPGSPGRELRDLAAKST